MMTLTTLKQTRVGAAGVRLKRSLRSKLNHAKSRVVKSLLSYDADALKARLRHAGVTETDTLLVHANFSGESGFRGNPSDLVNALVDLVGTKGNLMMVSIPFRGSAYDYLSSGKTFNVKKTISLMGLATEMFRRRPGTLRSFHPTHPVLVFGKDAEWLVAGHEQCLTPCGIGTPFDKFHQLRGKILFFDVSFGAITFFHYVEDLLKDRMPFPVYHPQQFAVTAIDAAGASRVIHTLTFNPAIARKAERLERRMAHDDTLRRGRVGNSRFTLVTAADVVSSFTAMVDSGDFPYSIERH